MAERRPPGFNVDLDFADSDEVLSIPRRHRASAIGVWTLCGTWSAKKLRDGYVPAEILKAYGATHAIIEALIASTLWKNADVGAIWFTNWPRWQRTRAEVTAYRQSEAKRKQDARSAAKDAQNSGDREMSARTTIGTSQDVRPEDGDPSTECVSTSSSEVTSSVCSPVGSNGVQHTRPSEHCPNHPHGTTDRCGDCGNHRRAAKAWDERRGAEAGAEAAATATARASEVARRDRCPACDPEGWLLDMWGEPTDPAIRCQHPGVA